MIEYTNHYDNRAILWEYLRCLIDLEILTDLYAVQDWVDALAD